MIISVASAKGGVGKTTIAANLGVVLNKRGARVLLVDADLSSGNLTLHMGGKSTSRNLHALLSTEGGPSEDEVRETVSLSLGVPLLPVSPSLRGYLKSKLDLLPTVLTPLKDDYDIILVDTPPGINKNSIIPLRESDRVLLVTTPDPVSVSDVANTKEVVILLERSIVGVVVNRVKKGKLFGSKQLRTAEIEGILKVKALGVIPEDKSVEAAVVAKRPVTIYKPRSAVSKAFDALARKLVEELR